MILDEAVENEKRLKSAEDIDMDLIHEYIKAKSILFGIIIRHDEAYKQLELGPNFENKNMSEQFREFWGPKSELRRFPDGRINEAVVWNIPSYLNYTIPDKCVAYALMHNLNLEVGCFSQSLDSLLRI